MVRAACYRAGMRHSLRAAGDPELRVVRALPAPLGSHYRWQGSALAGLCTTKSWGQDVSRNEAASFPLSRAPRPVTRASRGAGAALAEQSSLPRRPLHSPAESARTARARRAGGSARAGRAAVRSGGPGRTGGGGPALPGPEHAHHASNRAARRRVRGLGRRAARGGGWPGRSQGRAAGAGQIARALAARQRPARARQQGGEPGRDPGGDRREAARARGAPRAAPPGQAGAGASSC
jgi:hypothetical protein